MHVHGGGFQRGTRTNEWRGGPNAGRAAARHGCIGVVVSYTLAPPPLPAVFLRSLLGGLIFSLFALPSSWARSHYSLVYGSLVGFFFTLGIVHKYADRSKGKWNTSIKQRPCWHFNVQNLNVSHVVCSYY